MEGVDQTLIWRDEANPVTDEHCLELRKAARLQIEALLAHINAEVDSIIGHAESD
jgi:hypothetical protein